jgi:hypothetical protein
MNSKSIPLRRKQLRVAFHLYIVLNLSGRFPRSLSWFDEIQVHFFAPTGKKLSDHKLIFYLGSMEDFGGGLWRACVTHVTGKILKRLEKVCPLAAQEHLW